jgi:hypothetical protein
MADPGPFNSADRCQFGAEVVVVPPMKATALVVRGVPGDTREGGQGHAGQATDGGPDGQMVDQGPPDGPASV